MAAAGSSSDSTMRVAFVAALAALLGSAIGVVGGVWTQGVANRGATEARADDARRDACEDLVVAAHAVAIRLNSLSVASLGPARHPKDHYLDELSTVSTDLLPALYGSQAVVQLSTDDAEVSRASVTVVDTLVHQLDYLNEQVAPAADPVPVGTIARDHYLSLTDDFGVARNTFINSCGRELRTDTAPGTTPGAGWFRPARYEIAHHPDARTAGGEVGVAWPVHRV